MWRGQGHAGGNRHQQMIHPVSGEIIMLPDRIELKPKFQNLFQ